MYLVDTHIHLTDDRYQEEGLSESIANAGKANVSKLITLGTDYADSEKAKRIAEQHQSVFFCAGIHPHEAAKYTEDDILGIEKLLIHEKCVGVGEVGLDYYYDFADKSLQIELLKAMLELAEKNKKPIVLHTRSAEAEVLEMLGSYSGKVLCHSYTGEPELMGGYLEKGAYFSLNGMITFRKAENVREIAKKVPLERMLIESDGPYLSPAPHRGKLNLPEYLAITAKEVASVVGKSYEEVVRVTTENAERFFNC